MIKLYYSPGACSLVVRIILNELGLSFDDEKVDLKTKKTASDHDFLTINPKGAVPVLVLDNGDILTENQVILQYLADSTSNQQLLAKVGDLNRYRSLEWLNYVSTELHKTVGLLFNPAVSEEMKTKMLLPLITKRLEYVNAHLAHKDYLMGETFTLPDAYLFVILRWTLYFKIVLAQYPHLQQFMARMQARKAVVSALGQEK
jgi:glutathione S-transferase